LTVARKQSPSWVGRHNGWLWILSLFLVGLGARLWLIHRSGTALPFWDQWEEARTAYIPYFEGRLSLADFFAPHNENRILFNRLYGPVLLFLNGQFDNQLEMVVNAFLYSAGITGFGWLLARLMGRRFWPLISLPLMAALALPFAWENTLSGFHSQYYFMILFTLLTIWLLGLHEPGSTKWCFGVPVAIGTLFTLVGGLLAPAAVCGLVVLKVLRQPPSWKRLWPTMAVALVVVGLGLAFKIEVPYHRVMMAHSVTEFLVSLGKYLAWPWIVLPPFAVFNMFPLVLLTWFYLRDRQPRVPAEEIALAVGLWAVLQAVAAAYGRGGKDYPQWRYMDCTCFVMIVNALSLMLLWARCPKRWPLWHYFRVVAVLWVVACALGLALLISRAWRIDIPEREFYHRAQLQNTRAFMATGDIRVLDNKPNSQLPLYEGDPYAPRPLHAGEKLVKYLDNPWVRRILPACVRDPLKVVPESVTGFVTNGAARAKPRIPGEVSWGSYTKDGAATKGRFESLPVSRSKFPFLEFRVAGDLGKAGLSLTLIDLSSGKTTAVIPSETAGGNWRNCRVRAPSGDFKIVASDESSNGWFAFQSPREVGWLSWASVEVASLGGWIFATGLTLYLAGVVVVLRSRQDRDSPRCEPKNDEK
jgi:hypothetical protein